ncbi:MAG: hypothetical protein DRJ98_08525 [Thermoprotei archaeon]|nr:MAG: hypothetical protein DRJ98_08525 [Thermoprotei archaeon]
MNLPLTAKRTSMILVDFEQYLREQRIVVYRLDESHVRAMIIGKADAYRVQVDLHRKWFYCTCPHRRFRKALCKHVLITLELYASLTQGYEQVAGILRAHQEKII